MNMDAAKLDKLKKIELNMLKQFIEICEYLELRYYLVGGTLLGAVRHSGFIPWDDDIDVAMPRKDFEVFKLKAGSMLPDYYFLQTYHTDPEFPANFVKIRDNRTTFIESSVKKQKINHGIYIDVFPLDYFPEKKEDQECIWRKLRVVNKRLSLVYTLPRKHTFRSIVGGMISFIRYPYLKMALDKREKIFKSCNASSLYINFSGAWGEKEIVSVEWFENVEYMYFEGISACVPKKYHEYLSTVYGDYKCFPPIEERVAHHFAEAIDTEISYKEYHSCK